MMAAKSKTKKTSPKNKGGRPSIPIRQSLPQKEIILDQVLYWIGLQATAEEIASSFHVDVSTLDNKLKQHYGMGFSELKKRCDGSGKLSLRRYQFQQAKGNASMAIWLGKQWLGQKDQEKEIVKPQEFDNHLLIIKPSEVAWTKEVTE